MPQLVDADRDGDLDLLIGERNGNTNYFENTGNATAPTISSVPTTASFGFVDAKIAGQINGNAAPLLVEIGNEYHFFVGNQAGIFWHFTNVDNNLTGSFQRVNSSLDLIDDGSITAPTLGDIDADGQLDLILGNQRGGLTAYTDSALPNYSILNQPPNKKVKISPNPTSNSIKIDFPYVINNNVLISIFTPIGQLVYNQKHWFDDTSDDLSLDFLSTGRYMIRLQTSTSIHTQILLITK